MDNKIIIETNQEYTRLITKASKENINAYGWFMRYMQIEEDLYILIKEHDQIKKHYVWMDIDRCVEELKNAPDLNSRSSDEDSLNKGYEENQK